MTSDPIRHFYENFPYPNVERFSRVRLNQYATPLISAGNLKLNQLTNKTILDVGCGTGEISCSMAAHSQHVMGVDFSERSIEMAQQLAQKFGLKNADFVSKDLFSFEPFRKFDLVTCFGVLHHTPSFEKGFSRIAKWVKPKGMLLVGFYHPWGGFEQRLKKWISRAKYGNSPEKKLMGVEKRQKMKMNPHAQAFWADRIANPRETYHRVREVKRLFEENGFEVAGIQSHKQTLRVKNPKNNFEILQFELEIMLRRKRFVIMAGKN
jgi:SAM-dependent methyltransferase